MNWINTEQRYGKLSIGLHWLMLIVLVIVYACMELHGYFPKGSAVRDGMKTWHYMLGLAVLVLVTFRLFTRSLGPPPGITPKPPAWQQHLARHAHRTLRFHVRHADLGLVNIERCGQVDSILRA